MEINKQYISNNNSYAWQEPVYIVIHNTDNSRIGANAVAHAKAQYQGNFDGYSAHVYVDDTHAYQAMPYNRGAWHVGINYGGQLFGTVNNRNSVGIEMCMQAGYDYEKAFSNTVKVCRMLMKELKISAERVVQHYDVCAINCPSVIRKKKDWERFLKQIRENETGVVETAQKERKAVPLTKSLSLKLPELYKGCQGSAVMMLQAFLQVNTDGIFGLETEAALRKFQKNTAQSADGICGKNSWIAISEYMKINTFVA